MWSRYHPHTHAQIVLHNIEIIIGIFLQISSANLQAACLDISSYIKIVYSLHKHFPWSILGIKTF